MPRAKNRVAPRKRKKKVLKAARGYYGRRSRAFRDAKNAVDRSLKYQYRDRRNKKRELRSLWIVRINSAARVQGINYRNFIHGLRKANVALNRKVIADMAVKDRDGFNKLVEIAKANLSGN
ncbi:MAG: 50S ribosomal protein L20 [Elusimicrobiota bacterium]